MKQTKKKKATKVPAKEPIVVKNNSAFKRAMKQMDVKHGDRVTVLFDDGSMYIVECT